MPPVVRLGIFSVLPGLWLEDALPVGFVKGLCLHVGGDLGVMDKFHAFFETLRSNGQISA